MNHKIKFFWKRTHDQSRNFYSFNVSGHDFPFFCIIMAVSRMNCNDKSRSSSSSSSGRRGGKPSIPLLSSAHWGNRVGTAEYCLSYKGKFLYQEEEDVCRSNSSDLALNFTESKLCSDGNKGGYTSKEAVNNVGIISAGSHVVSSVVKLQQQHKRSVDKMIDVHLNMPRRSKAAAARDKERGGVRIVKKKTDRGEVLTVSSKSPFEHMQCAIKTELAAVQQRQQPLEVVSAPTAVPRLTVKEMIENGVPWENINLELAVISRPVSAWTYEMLIEWLCRTGRYASAIPATVKNDLYLRRVTHLHRFGTNAQIELLCEFQRNGAVASFWIPYTALARTQEYYRYLLEQCGFNINVERELHFETIKPLAEKLHEKEARRRNSNSSSSSVCDDEDEIMYVVSSCPSSDRNDDGYSKEDLELYKCSVSGGHPGFTISPYVCKKLTASGSRCKHGGGTVVVKKVMHSVILDYNNKAAAGKLWGGGYDLEGSMFEGVAKENAMSVYEMNHLESMSPSRTLGTCGGVEDVAKYIFKMVDNDAGCLSQLIVVSDYAAYGFDCVSPATTQQPQHPFDFLTDWVEDLVNEAQSDSQSLNEFMSLDAYCDLTKEPQWSMRYDGVSMFDFLFSESPDREPEVMASVKKLLYQEVLCERMRSVRYRNDNVAWCILHEYADMIEEDRVHKSPLHQILGFLGQAGMLKHHFSFSMLSSDEMVAKEMVEMGNALPYPIAAKENVVFEPFGSIVKLRRSRKDKDGGALVCKECNKRTRYPAFVIRGLFPNCSGDVSRSTVDDRGVPLLDTECGTCGEDMYYPNLKVTNSDFSTADNTKLTNIFAASRGVLVLGSKWFKGDEFPKELENCMLLGGSKTANIFHISDPRDIKHLSYLLANRNAATAATATGSPA